MEPGAVMLLGPPIAAMHSATVDADGDHKIAVDDNPVEKQVPDSDSDSKVEVVNFEGTPPMGRTENNSATFLATGNPCLDFFYHVVPSTPPDQVVERVQLAWTHDPLLTLKLVFNLRGVRGTGKSDKESFYAAALWLFQKHPKTLAFNLKALVEFGYLKDLPEILYRLLKGADVRKRAEEEKSQRVTDRRARLSEKWKAEKIRWTDEEQSEDSDSDSDSDYDYDYGTDEEDEENQEEEEESEETKREREERRKEREEKRKAMEEKERKREEKMREREARRKQKKEGRKEEKRREREERKKGRDENQEKEKAETAAKNLKETARKLRKEKDAVMARVALQRYKNDPDYRLLFDTVCHVFAELLKSDLEKVSSGKSSQISLAAKWCPSIDSSFDKATLVCEGIGRRVFPRGSHKEYEGVEEAHYAFKVRDRLRKQVLVPLRKTLELPEVYMSANKWDTLPYNRVASVAMSKYKTHFTKHDKERFDEYLNNVKEGKAKIAAGALLPHEIIKSLDERDGEKVAELQWERMVEDLSKKGKLSNCIAVCDVSGSMHGTPMEVCVALGLLVSELSEDPWKGKVITFSQEPQFQVVQGDTLRAKTEFIKEMDWGMNTNFQKVFDRMLEIAVEGKLSEEQMIKRVFVFSDMEFDQASYHDVGTCGEGSKDEEENQNANKETLWETDYEVIVRKFKAKGYNRVPEIVFWNLRNSSSTPVVANQKGVALVSGFAKNLLSLFLEVGGIVNPLDVMGLAIAGDEYKTLQVHD